MSFLKKAKREDFKVDFKLIWFNLLLTFHISVRGACFSLCIRPPSSHISHLSHAPGGARGRRWPCHVAPPAMCLESRVESRRVASHSLGSPSHRAHSHHLDSCASTHVFQLGFTGGASGPMISGVIYFILFHFSFPLKKFSSFEVFSTALDLGGLTWVVKARNLFRASASKAVWLHCFTAGELSSTTGRQRGT